MSTAVLLMIFDVLVFFFAAVIYNWMSCYDVPDIVSMLFALIMIGCGFLFLALIIVFLVKMSGGVI